MIREILSKLTNKELLRKMVFNLNQFKTILTSRGGPARSSLFVVEIIAPKSSYINSNDLRFFCQSVQLPGIDIDTVGYKPKTVGLPESMAIGIAAEQLNCTFMCDSEHTIMSFFHEWFQKIINYDVSGGVFSEVDGKLPYELGYRDEYSTTMTVKHYSSDNPSLYYEYKFEDVYPTKISSPSLSWSESETYSTVNVNFSYSSMKFKATATGIPVERLSRGTSYLERMNSIGFYGQRSNSSLPNNIQDAVDAFTRIKTNISRLKKLFN
jgi:hypothetical protein